MPAATRTGGYASVFITSSYASQSLLQYYESLRHYMIIKYLQFSQFKKTVYDIDELFDVLSPTD